MLAMMRPRVLIGMLIAGQGLRDVMDAQTAILQHLTEELRRQELHHTRYIHSLIQNFLSALDEDEEALREQLGAAVRDLADTVARMEEYSS